MITKYKNRYGDEYWFELISPNVFQFHGEMQFWRFGGLSDVVDNSNLGFVDPSGGPFIGLGDLIEGRKVVRIWCDDGIFFEVE